MLSELVDFFESDGTYPLGREIDKFLESNPRVVSAPAERYYPSGFASDYFCAKKAVIETLRFQEGHEWLDTRNAKGIKTAKIGTALHRVWQEDILGEMGILLGRWVCPACGYEEMGVKPKEACSCSEKREWHYKEQKVRFYNPNYPDKQVSGKVDGVLDLPGMGLVVLDIKTIGVDYFERLTKSGKGHIRQVGVYQKPLEIDKGVILYLCRDDGRHKWFYFDFDELDYKETFDNSIGAVKKAFDNKKVPNMQKKCRPNSWMRNSCPQANICVGCRKWDDLVERVKQEGTGV